MGSIRTRDRRPHLQDCFLDLPPMWYNLYRNWDYAARRWSGWDFSRPQTATG